MPVKHIRGNEIENVAAASDKISLVDFSAAWCGPCKMLDPVLNILSFALENDVGFYHIDVDESPTSF